MMHNSCGFYDAIAKEYNRRMCAYSSNEEVRSKVKEYFLDTVKSGNVLDFGGGTGLDLFWLSENNFNVYFCEPSSGMKNIAVELNDKQLKNNRVVFLEGIQTDFRQWSGGTFNIKFDGLLANFAVINSIHDLTLFFEKMGSILHPGGHLIASLLDTTFNGIIRYHPKRFLIALIKREDPLLITNYGNTEHVSYLHSAAKIRKASAKYFSCERITSLGGFGFMLIHFKRKSTTE